jgi:hypothetical protein
MLLTNDEKKLMVSELQTISEELDLIDFLRKYFEHEYSTIFDKEIEERILIAQDKCGGSYSAREDFDIRIYTFYQLKKYIPTKLDISTNYMNLKMIKVIIFFENIIDYFDCCNKENALRSIKIEEGKEVYKFFKELISDRECNISRFDKAIKILGWEKLTQGDLNGDKYHSMHDFLARLIADHYLMKYIDEFNELE